MFFSNSAWIERLVVGELEAAAAVLGLPLVVGIDADADSHVDISGVNPSVPYASCMCESVSPLVVYSSAAMSGS